MTERKEEIDDFGMTANLRLHGRATEQFGATANRCLHLDVSWTRKRVREQPERSGDSLHEVLATMQRPTLLPTHVLHEIELTVMIVSTRAPRTKKSPPHAECEWKPGRLSVPNNDPGRGNHGAAAPNPAKLMAA